MRFRERMLAGDGDVCNKHSSFTGQRQWCRWVWQMEDGKVHEMSEVRQREAARQKNIFPEGYKVFCKAVT